MDYGEPIPSDKKIEATQFFDRESIGRLLIKAVVDAQLPLGSYGGHVSLHVQDGGYSATVYVLERRGATRVLISAVTV